MGKPGDLRKRKALTPARRPPPHRGGHHTKGHTVTKRTPAQKLARKIQAETGKPYTACLAEAKQRLDSEPRPARPDNGSSDG